MTAVPSPSTTSEITNPSHSPCCARLLAPSTVVFSRWCLCFCCCSAIVRSRSAEPGSTSSYARICSAGGSGPEYDAENAASVIDTSCDDTPGWLRASRKGVGKPSRASGGTDAPAVAFPDVPPSSTAESLPVPPSQWPGNRRATNETWPRRRSPRERHAAHRLQRASPARWRGHLGHGEVPSCCTQSAYRRSPPDGQRLLARSEGRTGKWTGRSHPCQRLPQSRAPKSISPTL